MKRIVTLGMAIMMISNSFAQTVVPANPFPKTINVSGSAEIEIIPDEMYVTVTLTEYEKKGSGKIDIEKVKTAFLNSCRSIGLPDSLVTIASYAGATPYSWLKKKKKDELFATIAYQVKFSNSKKIDELVAKLDDEATQNFQISRVWHSNMQEYRKQLKIQAVKAAKEKAAYLADAIDEKIGEAITISEINDQPVVPFNMHYNMASNSVSQYRMEAGSSGNDGTDFKKIRLRMEVNAVFALK
jgi:Uncharacterized conserved protein